MSSKITFDSNNNVELPTLVLAKRSGDKLGTIPAVNIINKTTMNSGSELSFKVYKYNDDIAYSLWDELVDFKLLYCPNWNEWYEIYVEIDEGNETVKNVQCVSLGISELSQIKLYNIEINTDNDIEGEDFDTYGKTILHSSNPKISMLDRILKDKAPHYHIGYIDDTLIKETEGRLVQFTFDNISIYDALQEIAKEINALLVIDTSTITSSLDRLGDISRTINFYDLETNCLNCGHRGDFKHTCPECGYSDEYIKEGYGDDTAIFVSVDNLSEGINFTTDHDSVKNCFKLSAGDEVMTDTVRNCNPNGSSYIWYISDALKREMSDDLVGALDDYDALYEEYQSTHMYHFDTTDYNALINKYKIYNTNLSTISSDIMGYPRLMNSYYDILDFYQYLYHQMMPSVSTEDTNAQSELNKVRDELTATGVSIRNYSEHTSQATVESTIKNVISVLVSSNYKVTIETESITFNSVNATGSWVGNITLERYYDSDEDPKATLSSFTINLNADAQIYYKQLIEKKISKSESASTNNAQELFKLDILGDTETAKAVFASNLQKYSVKCLIEFQTICEAILNILTEQGVADSSQWDGLTGRENLYNQLYIPYYDRGLMIESELALRETEVSKITSLQDLFDIQREATMSQLNLESFLVSKGDGVWVEFCSFRREDEYSNQNYISDGLNNAELFNQALKFIEIAKKEIYKSATLQHTITSTLHNLLVMDEFKSLVNCFETGNWIRIQVDDSIYKLRLTEYEIDFDNIEKITVTFSDIKTTVDGYSDIENIINSAKSISSTYQSTQRQADNGDRSQQQIQHWFNDGLSVANIRLQSDSIDQTQFWNENGMLFRRVIPETEEYDDVQIKIINSTLAITNDNWRSVKAAVGRFSYKDMTDGGVWKDGYGINAEVLCGRLILGETLAIYNNTTTENNSLTFNSDGLIVTGNNNTVRINANPTSGEYNNSIFTITRNNGGNEQTLISFDNNGYGLIGGWKIDDNEISKSGTLSNGDNYKVFMSSVPYDDGLNNPYNPMFGVRYNGNWEFYVRSNGQLFAKNAEIIGSVTSQTDSDKISLSDSTIALYQRDDITREFVEYGTLTTGNFFNRTGVFLSSSNPNGYLALGYTEQGNYKYNRMNLIIHDGTLETDNITFDKNNVAFLNGFEASGECYIYNMLDVGGIISNGAISANVGEDFIGFQTDGQIICGGTPGIYGRITPGLYCKGSIKAEGVVMASRLDISGDMDISGGINSPTTSTFGQLYVNGWFHLGYSDYYAENGYAGICISEDGTVYKNTSNRRINRLFCSNAVSTSDRKLKKDIKPLNCEKAKEFIMNLNPCSFLYKDNEHGRKHLGFIAQEVAEISPSIFGDLSLYEADVVNDDGSTSYYDPNIEDEKLAWGLKYSELIAPLTAFVQMQQKKIETLEEKMKILEGKLKNS